MTLETLTQTAKTVAQRCAPHVKILAHHLLPNLSHYNLDGRRIPIVAERAHYLGYFAKAYGLGAILCYGFDDASPYLKDILLYSGIASQSLGIILQNGVYDNVRRWHSKCQ